MKNVISLSLALIMIGAFLVVAPAQAATTPVASSLTATAGLVKWKIGTKSYSVRPWGKTYTGKIYAKKVVFGSTAVVLTVAQAAGGHPDVKLYSSSAKLITERYPFYGAHYRGYNVSLIVQPKSKKVYVAFGTKQLGVSALIWELTTKGFSVVNSVDGADTADKGQVIVKFLKIYSNEYGLVTMIADKPATLKLWRYSSSTHRFDEDTTTDKSLITVNGNSLSL